MWIALPPGRTNTKQMLSSTFFLKLIPSPSKFDGPKERQIKWGSAFHTTVTILLWYMKGSFYCTSVIFVVSGLCNSAMLFQVDKNHCLTNAQQWQLMVLAPKTITNGSVIIKIATLIIALHFLIWSKEISIIFLEISTKINNDNTSVHLYSAQIHRKNLKTINMIHHIST